MVRLFSAAVLVLLAMGVAGCGTSNEHGPEPTESAQDSPTGGQASSAGSSPSATSAVSEGTATPAEQLPRVQEYPVPRGSHPHDVAPAEDGGVWYTAQATGKLGWLDPTTGEVVETSLGPGSAPHGVIVGPEGGAWVTDGGQNAIVRVDAKTRKVDVYKLPASAPNANLNTAAFDSNGILWWTGQTGYYGRLDPANPVVEAWAAPRGRGPYGITATPDGRVFYASLAGNHIAEINTSTGAATVIEPPTTGQGARRVWSDSSGRIWVSEWNAGQVSVYNPPDNSWKQWKLPGTRPQTYSVYVDDRDIVWLTDFGANAIVSFDPETEQFTSYELPSRNGAVRQMLGRRGEVWGAESGADKIIVVRTD